MTDEVFPPHRQVTHRQGVEQSSNETSQNWIDAFVQGLILDIAFDIDLTVPVSRQA